MLRRRKPLLLHSVTLLSVGTVRLWWPLCLIIFPYSLFSSFSHFSYDLYTLFTLSKVFFLYLNLNSYLVIHFHPFQYFFYLFISCHVFVPYYFIITYMCVSTCTSFCLSLSFHCNNRNSEIKLILVTKQDWIVQEIYLFNSTCLNTCNDSWTFVCTFMEQRA